MRITIALLALIGGAVIALVANVVVGMAVVLVGVGMLYPASSSQGGPSSPPVSGGDPGTGGGGIG
jgi:hypothetical protein